MSDKKMSFNSRIRPPSKVDTNLVDTENLKKRRAEAINQIKKVENKKIATQNNGIKKELNTINKQEPPKNGVRSNGIKPGIRSNLKSNTKPEPKESVKSNRPQPLVRKSNNLINRPGYRTKTTSSSRDTSINKSNNDSSILSNISSKLTKLKSVENILDQSKTEIEPATPPKKKRPAWDIKGRLEDMEVNTNYLRFQVKSSKDNLTNVNEKLKESQNQIVQLEEFRKSLESKVQSKTQENSGLQHQVLDLENKIKELNNMKLDEINMIKNNHSMEINTLNSKLDFLNREKTLLNTELENVSNQLKAKIDENASLTNTISSQATSFITLESENRVLKNQLEASQKEALIKGEKIVGLNNNIVELKEVINSLETKLRNEETIRRQLHNTIQELKGNIRVFCRVRPPIGDECNQPDIQSHLNYSDKDGDGKCIEIKQIRESSMNKSTSKTYPFTFDKVYTPSATQSIIFEDISQLVQSALDGYPVCIFAYGQTGSGKTFTMEGPANATSETEGMIPRAVQQIFNTAEELKEKGWEYKMECQYLEIYNETLHDLLKNNNLENKKLDIKHDSTNNTTTVTDINSVIVSDPKSVYQLLNKASKNRAVASTNCNERSSRSHSVFTMRLSGTNNLTSEKSEGVLNLIDLAGSESLNKSGSTGDRLRETQAINKSLSCLSDVFYNLSQNNAHVPYRNSKLTYLLQNSLGGNSKTLMFVNISPLKYNLQESLFSLQFATKVNNCHIGTAKKVIR